MTKTRLTSTNVKTDFSSTAGHLPGWRWGGNECLPWRSATRHGQSRPRAAALRPASPRCESLGCNSDSTASPHRWNAPLSSPCQTFSTQHTNSDGHFRFTLDSQWPSKTSMEILVDFWMPNMYKYSIFVNTAIMKYLTTDNKYNITLYQVMFRLYVEIHSNAINLPRLPDSNQYSVQLSCVMEWNTWMAAHVLWFG